VPAEQYSLAIGDASSSGVASRADRKIRYEASDAGAPTRDAPAYSSVSATPSVQIALSFLPGRGSRTAPIFSSAAAPTLIKNNSNFSADPVVGQQRGEARFWTNPRKSG
jgi:hypothetical protein